MSFSLEPFTFSGLTQIKERVPPFYSEFTFNDEFSRGAKSANTQIHKNFINLEDNPWAYKALNRIPVPNVMLALTKQPVTNRNLQHIPTLRRQASAMEIVEHVELQGGIAKHLRLSPDLPSIRQVEDISSASEFSEEEE